MKVLILAADQKQAIPILQSLGRINISVACLSQRRDAPAFFSRYCTERILFEAAAEKARYIDFLKRKVGTGVYDLIIPCSDRSTLLVSEHRDDLLPHARICLPGHAMVKTVTDKSALMKLALKHRISVPKTYFPRDSTEMAALEPRLSYPVVVKGNITAGGKNVKYARTRRDLARLFQELHQPGGPPIIQEYIEGREKIFYGLCDDGEVLAFCMMESQRAYPPSGGTPAKAVSLFSRELLEYSRSVVHAARWTGMVGLDIKQARESNKLHLLDFNPRFGATLALAVKSGVDLPRLLIEFAVEGKKSPPPEYGRITYRSLFREDLFHAARRPTALPKQLLEFFQPRTYYGRDKDDPAPFFHLAKNSLRQLAGSLSAKIRPGARPRSGKSPAGHSSGDTRREPPDSPGQPDSQPE